MIRNVVVLSGLILVLLVGSQVAASERQAALDDLKGGAKLNALVDLVVEQQRSVSTLRARFVQRKSSALLLNPVDSTGDFRFLAPDRVRWDYEEPDRMVVIFSGETLTTYRPDDKSAEQVKVARQSRRFVKILAGTQPLDELREQFRISLVDRGAPEPYVLTLKPIHRTLKRKIDSVMLEVDRERLLPVVIEYNEADGDSTRYELRSLEVDSGIDESVFALELGEDVRVETIDMSG